MMNEHKSIMNNITSPWRKRMKVLIKVCTALNLYIDIMEIIPEKE